MSARRSPPISIAIPASFVSGIPHLREKTVKTGIVGRSAAIFRIEEIVVYSDLPGQDQSRDADLISSILSYMETPQYLRKRLFPHKPSLRYAGVLPPLRTPHHPTTKLVRDLRSGEFREGVIVKSDRRGSYVDIGVERPAVLPRAHLPPERRVTVRIVGFHRGAPEAYLTDRDEVSIYWGYSVTVPNMTLGQLVKRGRHDLVVGTSRRGRPIVEVIQKLKKKWRRAQRVLLAFGSPNEGLREILEHENLKLEDVAHFVVNTIPDQGTETVRTEEAIHASLAVLNLMI
ncbi:MAG: putative RNA uridine N3 methyltransferase [Candidatus Bathyarchaeia archaeon]